RWNLWLSANDLELTSASCLIPPIQRWFCLHKEAIAIKDWDGECVCFLEYRDTNHHLTPVAGTILEVLLQADKSLSANELFTLVFGSEDKSDCGFNRAEGVSSLESILYEFERIGLAESDLS
ncbi:MAG TPA: hypothetical protein VF296_03925, partial [Gallionella sp.]